MRRRAGGRVGIGSAAIFSVFSLMLVAAARPHETVGPASSAARISHRSATARSSTGEHKSTNPLPTAIEVVGNTGIHEAPVPPVPPTGPSCPGPGAATQFPSIVMLPEFNLYGGMPFGAAGGLESGGSLTCFGDSCTPLCPPGGGGGNPPCNPGHIEATSPDSGPRGGGCGSGSCGGGGGEDCLLAQPAMLGLKIDMRPEKAIDFGGGFAPGFELNGYGSWVHCSQFTENSVTDTIIQFNDTTNTATRNFFDRGAGSSFDGVCYDEAQLYMHAQLMDGGVNGTPTDDIDDADAVVVTYYTGVRMEFELWTILNPMNSFAEKRGRLVAIRDKNGRATTITYVNSLTSYAGLSAYKIDEVTDPYGAVMAFTYGSDQSGQPAISQIDFPNGESATFSYSSGKLYEINMAEDWKCRITFGTDSPSQCTTIAVNHPAMGTATYYVTQDYIQYNGGILNQPLNVLRLVQNGNSQDVIAIFQNPGEGTEYRVLYGEDALSLVKLGEYQAWYTAWDIGDPDDGWDAFIDLTLESPIAPANLFGGSPDPNDVLRGMTPEYRDPYGAIVDVTYDSEGFVTRKDYEDNSFETWTYEMDAKGKRVTRYRDRMARVTKFDYDANGNLTEKQVGILDVSGTDTNQSEYAEYRWDYDNDGYLETAFSPRNTSESDLYRTDYTYHTNHLLETIVEAADAASGTRPETEYTWNGYFQLVLVEDQLDRATSLVYDDLGRCVQITHDDTSTEQIKFGAGGTSFQADMVVGRKNRIDVVDTTTYDASGRVTQMTRAGALDSNIRDGQAYATTVTDPNLISVTALAYMSGSCSVPSSTSDNRTTDVVFDYKRRPISTTVYPSDGVSLETETVYVGNRVFYSEDPYGRREYMGYSATNSSELIRRVQANHPDYTVANNAAVLALTRDTGANAEFVIADAIKDAEGNLLEVIDGRGNSTTYEYDSREREVVRKDAEGTSVEAKTETDYDEAGHVVEIRHPRYFDSGDSGGYQLSKTTFTYNGRGLQASQVVKLNSTQSATTSTTYYLDGKPEKRTDPRSYDWYSYYQSCCGRVQGSKNPAGHGTLSNTDSLGRVTHSVVISDYASHTDPLDPIDAKTYAESTTRFDALGRTSATTRWLEALGDTIDPDDVPIAGLDSIDEDDGITTQTLYDSDLTDNVGLDNSTGMTVSQLGGGTFSVSLAACLTKLADTTANGGADTSFDDDCAGSAVVSISPNEDVLSVSISDGSGRSVMTAQIQGPGGGSANALVTWSCTKYDIVTEISGFGDCLETQSIDALGNVTKSLADGSGRVLKSIDAEDNASTAEYDANGNVVESRDANGVGYDAVYDELNRMTSQTDTWTDDVAMTYDKAGNLKTQTDAKSEVTTFVYDAANRKVTVTDRLAGDTDYVYDVGGNLTSLTDAESQTTAYAYNNVGQKTSETYPDHTGGSSGSSTYGIVEFSYDPAGRVQLKTDQNGDTVTYNYDLAGRMTQRDYRTKANSPTGTIADSDTFTFDRSSRMLTGVKERYSNTVTMAYEEDDGRLSGESLTIGGKTYTTGYQYDQVGRVWKLTYPKGTVVERLYTDRGQLATVKYAGNTIDTRTYDAGGRLSTSTYGNGVATTWTYRFSGTQKDNLISSIAATHPGGVASDKKVGTYSYTWDANKNKTAETLSGNPITGHGFSTGGSGYDEEDRLLTWNRDDSNKDQSWDLSLVGDWDSFTEEGTTQYRTHGAAHELTAIGSNSVSYDPKGNITQNRRSASSSTWQNYVWDFDNHLQSADIDGDSTPDVDFEYDVFGRRVGRNGTTDQVYAHAGQQVVCDYTRGTAPTGTILRSSVWGSYVDEVIARFTNSGGVTYFHHNQQYSTIALSNSSGEVFERYAYDAYGNFNVMTHTGSARAWTVNTNRYLYTGREWDDSLKLFYFRARWYDPLLGRFVGRDPLGYWFLIETFNRNKSGICVNLFELTLGSPLNYMDPGGTQALPPIPGPTPPQQCFCVSYYSFCVGLAIGDYVIRPCIEWACQGAGNNPPINPTELRPRGSPREQPTPTGNPRSEPRPPWFPPQDPPTDEGDSCESMYRGVPVCKSKFYDSADVACRKCNGPGYGTTKPIKLPEGSNDFAPPVFHYGCKHHKYGHKDSVICGYCCLNPESSKGRPRKVWRCKCAPKRYDYDDDD